MNDKKKDVERTENMNTLATRAGQDIQQMAAMLADYPTPDKWTPEQKEQTIRFAALLDTAQKVIAGAKIVGIDYDGEKTKFLDNASKTNSRHTRIAYNAALKRLDEWTARHKINPLELTPAPADDFIYALKAEGRSTASIRTDIAACSSFFTFLYRRHSAVDNPFRGTKARPVKKAVKAVAIPTAAEVRTIIAELEPMESAAVSVMAFRGLRAGALVEMIVTGCSYTSCSKGKDIKGTLPADVLKTIKMAGLDVKKPFAGIPANTLEQRIIRAIKKLHKEGVVSGAFSCHDFRHFYAVSEYGKDKDIYRLQKLLDHASIQVTENYLKSIDVEI